MVQIIKAFTWLEMLLLLSLSACGGAETPVPTFTSTPTADDSTLLTLPIATPYSLEPAAGICASVDGEIVAITLNQDMPDPRCSKVTGDQKLTLFNNTPGALQVALGVFSSTLEPGAEYTINWPVADYLAPGVHQLQVVPCCGAEIWLEANP